MTPLGWLVGSFLLAELYKQYATPEQKARWESSVNMHHGEAGAIMTLLGLISNSPRLAASGAGLMLHDGEDQNEWFKGKRFQNYVTF